MHLHWQQLQQQQQAVRTGSESHARHLSCLLDRQARIEDPTTPSAYSGRRGREARRSSIAFTSCLCGRKSSAKDCSLTQKEVMMGEGRQSII